MDDNYISRLHYIHQHDQVGINHWFLCWGYDRYGLWLHIQVTLYTSTWSNNHWFLIFVFQTQSICQGIKTTSLSSSSFYIKHDELEAIIFFILRKFVTLNKVLHYNVVASPAQKCLIHFAHLLIVYPAWKTCQFGKQAKGHAKCWLSLKFLDSFFFTHEYANYWYLICTKNNLNHA